MALQKALDQANENNSHQHGYCCKCGLTLESSAVVHYQQRFRRTEFCWAFSCYLVLSNHYWTAVPGRTSNEFHTCSNTCPLVASVKKHPKNFNRQLFCSSTIIFGLLLIPIFLSVWADEEGTLGTNSFLIFLSKLSFLFRFPILTIIGNNFDNFGGIVFLFLLLLNTIFYGLLIERLITLTFKRQATK